MSHNEVCFPKIRSTEIGSSKMSRFELNFSEVGIGKICFNEKGKIDISFSKRSFFEAGSTEMHTSKISPVEISTIEVDFLKIDVCTRILMPPHVPCFDILSKKIKLFMIYHYAFSTYLL